MTFPSLGVVIAAGSRWEEREHRSNPRDGVDGLPAACIALTMGEPPLAARDEPFQQTFAFVECPPSIELELAS